MITLASGVAASIMLLRLPSDGGLSAQRLLVLGGMAALLAGWTAAGLLGLFRDTQEFRYRAYAERLAPPFYWLTLTGVLLLVVLLVAHRRDLARAFNGVTGELRRWGWIWLGLALVAGVVLLTGIGKPITDWLGSYGNPAAPLFEWQVILAVLLAFPAAWLANKIGGQRADLVIGFVLWLVTVILWAGQPLLPGFFATAGRAPNFEIYPFSDAATYDTYAQSLLVGNGFMGDAIPQRAFYIVFLAGLHLLAGQDYVKVIFAQTLVLALLPVLIYWIGRELHGRAAGLLAALFVILRELIAIRSAPFTGNLTYSKLYFSELPAAVCLAAFTLMAVRWLKRPGERTIAPLLAGGFLGMAMLIRTQSFSVLSPVLLLSLLAYRPWRFKSTERWRQWKGWLRGAALLGVGLVACVSPWLARNWGLAGGLAFDNSTTQTMVMAARYNNIMMEMIPKEPGESEVQYSSRLMRMTLQGMARDPGLAAWQISSHFTNNEIANLMILPVRFQMNSVGELLWPEKAFWQKWDRSLTGSQALLVVAFLGLLAAGLAGATCRSGWIALALPLGSMLYNLGSAVFRSSGDRFLAPVDWMVLLLYAIGIAQLASWARWLAGRHGEAETNIPAATAERSSRHPLRSIALAALAFLLVGSTLPLAERVFPARYGGAAPAQIRAELDGALAKSGSSQKAAAVRELLGQPGVILLKGRALYPRFYGAGESEPATAKTGYAGMDFARLVFPVVGTENTLIVLPANKAPKVPNTADVLVVGCPAKLYVRALAVAVENGPVYLTGENVGQACGK